RSRLRQPSLCMRPGRPARRGPSPARDCAVRTRARRRPGHPLAAIGAGPAAAERASAAGDGSRDPGRGGADRSGFIRQPPHPSGPVRPRARSRSVVLKPDREGLTRAAQMLRSGGVVAFPTDTVYGLGADASDEVAQKRIFVIKNRPVGMPLILMAAAESQLEGWVHIDTRAEQIIRRWWP